jgi:hypothetical protein
MSIQTGLIRASSVSVSSSVPVFIAITVSVVVAKARAFVTAKIRAATRTGDRGGVKGSRQKERYRGRCYDREFSAACQKRAAILIGVDFGGVINFSHTNPFSF